MSRDGNNRIGAGRLFGLENSQALKGREDKSALVKTLVKQGGWLEEISRGENLDVDEDCPMPESYLARERSRDVDFQALYGREYAPQLVTLDGVEASARRLPVIYRQVELPESAEAPLGPVIITKIQEEVPFRYKDMVPQARVRVSAVPEEPEEVEREALASSSHRLKR